MICVILFLLILYNLASIIREKAFAVYKDVRFWLVVGSFLLLALLVIKSYPV